MIFYSDIESERLGQNLLKNRFDRIDFRRRLIECYDFSLRVNKEFAKIPRDHLRSLRDRIEEFGVRPQELVDWMRVAAIHVDFLE